MTLTYSIADVAPYINWLYFDHAWGMSGKPEAERQQLRREAEERLSRYADRYHSRAVFALYDCRSEDEDIVLSVRGTEESSDGVARIPLLRQQQAGSEYLCLADFISPDVDRIGLFATTVDGAIVTDFEDDPYEKMMMQLVADRLAEATAERLHEQVRKTFWGYARDEQLTMEEMQQERFQGIRPAVGYPSLPDTSLNFVIDRLIDMKQTGIRLTESGAMKPHASVSGLMLAHPAAHYFSIGKIGDDQLADYARRRDVPVSLMRKFLGGNL
jgi:cobalamin-dependent methionine synthase I